jgi:uncharacterized protein YutE (UPF0331/DUF86 family)
MVKAMSWREFIAALADTIVWPAVIAFGIWLFRHQIRALLDGPVKRWKAGPIEVEYEWARATEQVGKSVASLDAITGRRDELDELVELAEKAPVAAILAAHNAVEDLVRSIAIAADINDAADLSLDKLTVALTEREIIDTRTSDALAGIITLRNLAVHGPEPVGRRAREYIVLAEGVLYAIGQSHRVRSVLAKTVVS